MSKNVFSIDICMDSQMLPDREPGSFAIGKSEPENSSVVIYHSLFDQSQTDPSFFISEKPFLTFSHF